MLLKNEGGLPPKFDDLPDMMTVSEVAQFLRTTEEWVRQNLGGEKGIPFRRIGNGFQVPKTGLGIWLGFVVTEATVDADKIALAITDGIRRVVEEMSWGPRWEVK